MRRALDEYFIDGIKTNLPLFRRILDHPDFQSASIDTGFLDRLLSSQQPAKATGNGALKIAAISAAFFAATAGPPVSVSNRRRQTDQPDRSSAWKRAGRLEGTERP
jgi:acetyl-CoA carboxylase biotin carboxylase subunit